MLLHALALTCTTDMLQLQYRFSLSKLAGTWRMTGSPKNSKNLPVPSCRAQYHSTELCWASSKQEIQNVLLKNILTTTF